MLKGCGCKHLTEERHARANMGRCLCSTLIHTVGWQCGFPGQLTHPVRALPKWRVHIRLSRVVRRSPNMPMSNLWKGARVEERRCNTRGSCRPSLSDGRVARTLWRGCRSHTISHSACSEWCLEQVDAMSCQEAQQKDEEGAEFRRKAHAEGAGCLAVLVRCSKC